jgi:hypothetical protein
MAAKVDSAAVQDGYQIYHHVMVFDRQGHWAVVQQGMNPDNRMARRYHWLGEAVADFCCEPHSAVCSDARGETLNMVAAESDASRTASAEISRLKPTEILREVQRIQNLDLPQRHLVQTSDIADRYLSRVLLAPTAATCQFRAVVGIRGVGPATVRA